MRYKIALNPGFYHQSRIKNRKKPSESTLHPDIGVSASGTTESQKFLKHKWGAYDNYMDSGQMI